jgi:hypothetical protein
LAQFDTSTGDSALKVFYLPKMQDLLNQMSVLWMRLDKGSGVLNADGKSFTLGLHVGRNANAGIGVAENAAIPAADYQKTTTSIVPNKYIYTPIQVSGPVIKASKTDAGSFVRAVRFEVEGATKDTKKSANRQINGDTRDALAFYVSGSGSTSGVVDDGQGNIFSYLQPQAMTLDLVDASDHSTILQAAQSVTLGNETTNGFTITTGANISGSASAGSGYRYNNGSSGADYYVLNGSLGYQLTGLLAIISASDPINAGGQYANGLQNLLVSGKPYWKSQIVGDPTAFQDLRFPLMQRVISKIGMFSPFSEDDVKFIHTSPYGRDKYVELCSNERRTFNTMKLDGGFEAVSYNGIALFADPDAQIGRFNFIIPDALKIVRTADFDWIDDGGGILRKVASKDQFEAVLFHYGNLATVARNGLGALVGINM